VTRSRLLAAVLLAAPAWATDVATPARPSLSWAEAQSLGRKLEDIEKRNHAKDKQRRGSVLITEGELNSYLNLTYAPQMPPGLSDVDVRLEAERIRARGVVDLERVRGKVPPPSPWSPLALLRGKVPVELAGRLQTRDGYGTIEVEEASIASVPVPMSFLEQIVSSATRNASDPDGFDIHAPFRLPYAVNRIRVELARAFLEWN
jgi:hypothetical protein